MTTPDFLKSLFHPHATPGQQSCGHLLSYRMEDGKYFCASCRLVADFPLRRKA